MLDDKYMNIYYDFFCSHQLDSKHPDLRTVFFDLIKKLVQRFIHFFRYKSPLPRAKPGGEGEGEGAISVKRCTNNKKILQRT